MRMEWRKYLKSFHVSERKSIFLLKFPTCEYKVQNGKHKALVCFYFAFMEVHVLCSFFVIHWCKIVVFLVCFENFSS